MLEVLLNNSLQVSAIYDSGSNVTLINANLVNLKDSKNSNIEKTNLRTINGVNKTDGMITIQARIMDIEDTINVFVVNNEHFKYDFLIGLDCIKKFKLIQDENLQIKQKIPGFPTGIKKEIKNNKDSKTNNVAEEKDRQKTDKVQNFQNFQINFNEHINTENFEISVNHLENYERLEIEKLIDKYKTIFAKDKYDVGTVKDYEARIDLIVDKYCSKRPYRCSLEDKEEIEKQIAELLKKKLIEESYSPFAAPLTLAYKRDEDKKSRMCVDFRDLNKLILPQSQPFPLIEDLVTKTRNCKYFSKLDINSAFWSIPLRFEDKHKTGFVTQEGHFQWTCLPFGLKTAPAIFQRILSNILRKYKLTLFAVNYIDDILIFSKSFEEHICHLEKLLEAILKEGFRLKLTKCFFALDSVTYLGHVISCNSISPINDNLISIKNFPVPKTQKNIRQFLGKINFYNKFIPRVSTVLEPMHNLLRKNQKFLWTQDCQDTFEKLKEYLCTTPILSIFDPELPIRIYTDASLEGIGAVLKQPKIDEKGEETEHPVAYFSRKLNDAQKKKKAIHIECLAIKGAVKFWQHWLMGKYFTIFSDHKPLENLNIKARTDEELGDLSYYLSQYDFKIEYYPGKKNLEADCLSRNPVLEPIEDNEDCLKVVNLITLEEILEDQESNEYLLQNKDKFKQKNDLYYKKTRKKEKIILTEHFSKKLIRTIHKTFCHIGIRQMQDMISPHYTATNLTKNITTFCKNCEICKKNKSRGHDRLGLMSQLGPAKEPFELISIDTIGGFGGRKSTKKYLHLLVDHFTRYAYILTSKTQSSDDFIKLTKNIIENVAVGTVLTDQYPGLNSKEFKKFLNDNNTSLIFTAVNAPFSNGLNERLNQTLVNKIRCKINEQKKGLSWTTIAHECVKQYNNTKHTVTGFTPNYLLSGADTSILPQELKRNETIENLQLDRRIALENSVKYHNYNKKIYDKKRKNCTYNAGDLVYVENGNSLNRKKLDELKIGPYKILKKISNSIYEINTGHKKTESNLFHVSKISPVTNNEDHNTKDED